MESRLLTQVLSINPKNAAYHYRQKDEANNPYLKQIKKFYEDLENKTIAEITQEFNEEKEQQDQIVKATISIYHDSKEYNYEKFSALRIFSAIYHTQAVSNYRNDIDNILTNNICEERPSLYEASLKTVDHIAEHMDEPTKLKIQTKLETQKCMLESAEKRLEEEKNRIQAHLTSIKQHSIFKPSLSSTSSATNTVTSKI